MKQSIIIIILLFTSILLTKAQCLYNFTGLKVSSDKTISINLGTLRSDNTYSGIQGTMPLFGSKTFSMNAEIGRGFGIGAVGCIYSGVAGLYCYNNGNWKLNYGAGFTTFYKGIAIGLNYTNNERFSLKIGIYFSSYDY